MAALLSGFRSQVSSFSLGLRWFILNLRLILVCTGIAFWNRVATSTVRWQVRLLRWSGLYLLAFSISLLAFLSGCASHREPVAVPSPVGVIRAVSGAQTAAARLAPHVAPEGKSALAELNDSLSLAQSELSRYTVLVERESLARQKAEESAAYWRGKQAKALKELWLWRGAAALILGCVAGWFALRAGLKAAL